MALAVQRDHSPPASRYHLLAPDLEIPKSSARIVGGSAAAERHDRGRATAKGSDIEAVESSAGTRMAERLADAFPGTARGGSAPAIAVDARLAGW